MDSHSKKIKETFDEEIQDKFKHDYEYHRWFEKRIDRDRFDIMKKTISFHLKDISYKKCFELGPGPGTWTKVLKEHEPDAQCTLLDISQKMKEQFFRNVEGTENISYEIGAFEDYRLRKGRFDFFFSSRAIEYILDKKMVLKKVYSLLVPGGVGMIITKTPHYMKMQLLGQSTSWHHKNQIYPNDFVGLVGKLGFTDIEVYPVIIYIPIFGKIRLVNRILWRLLYRLRLSIFIQWITESYIVVFKKP